MSLSQSLSKTAVVLVSILPLAAWADDGVKGPNVHYVQCRSEDGRFAQQYSQVGAQQWVFFNRAGQSRNYDEVQRDEWSVYLKSADGLKTQLDLFKKTCTVQKADGSPVSSGVVAFAHSM